MADIDRNDKIYQGLLYDFYGELLNEHRRAIMEDYLFSDFSESEIAQDQQITRQAAHDLIHRSVKALEEYERKLGLLEKFLAAKKKLGLIQSVASQAEISKAELDRISQIAKEIEDSF